ncbi:hypothetical protein [Helicobacter equorum]|uniref:Uncharacterized protein n=1 Tax=Helicobacter equorum TaxID=361872 RepID=A0A3D8IPX6_9HELI|nr:hypothetical protein [Helicobacter equorum]RDU67318.1 hypothetical protein CQA54_04920 [Helicobacter equorum]
MWFLFFFIAIPFILFIGFLVFGIFAIFLINRIFHKKYSQSFSLILPCFSLIFYFILITGGISFKSIDPQYYEFKRLCKKAEDEVTIYNEDYWEIIEKHSDIETNDRGCFYSQKLKQEICFGNFNYKSCTEYKRGSLSKLSIKRYYNNIHYATQIGYNYKYSGLYLKGDESAGWHWKTSNILICEDLKNEKGH